MGKKIRSARGEMVDFDLLKIKEQIANQPPPQDVRARQDFIEKRLRRRLKKVAPPAPPVKKDVNVEADPKMPATEELSEETKMIDEVVEEPKTRSRQKARPPAKDKKDKE
jgi:hypothetical protein